MAIPTGERSLHKVQIGAESVEGVADTVDILFPAESSSIIELDRAPNTPEEDWGEFSNSRPGRSVYGVRQATMPMRSTLRFEDVIRILEAGLCGGVTPTNPATGVYSWVYDHDNTADTLVSQTVEDGDNQAVYRMVGSLLSRIRFSFDAVNPTAASPWMLELQWVGYDKELIEDFSVAAAPSEMETAMGHLCRLYLGSTATAFGSLPEVPGSILSADITIETGVVLRKQGGSDDIPDSHGRQRVKVTFTIVVEQTADTVSAFWDDFERGAADPQMFGKRMRLRTSGSNLDTDERVSITPTTGADDVTGGSFTLEFDSQTTGPIPWNATAGQVQAALWALSSIEDGNVSVTGPAGGPWVIRFINDLGATNVGAVTVDDTEITGDGTPAVVGAVEQAGSGPTPKAFILDFQAEIDQIPVQEANGSTRYSLTGRSVYDPALATSLRTTVINGVSA